MERERRAKLRRVFGHAHVEQAPDPAPPRLLAELLREDRDRWGYDFGAAWSENLEFVLARVIGRIERESWREVLEATRDCWAAAWANEPGPGERLSSALLNELEGDSASPPLVLG